MANYKDIKGFQIQSTSSDPVPYSGTWASVANINTARSAFQNRGGGSNTQGFVVGGLEPAISSKTESWNGSAWSEVGDTPAGARSGMATGAYTSAIQGGGDPGAGKTGECDTWNGSSWTEVAELNSAREIGGAGGASSTSALFFGGSGPNPSRAITEKWDGSSWTEVGDLNTGRNMGVGLGTQTAALAIAGYVPPSASGKKDLVEQWNGTSWTAINTLNTARMDMGGSGLGVTAAIAYGGQYPPSTKIADTEQFDGTSWTEVNNLGTARGSVGSIGTSSTGVVSAGGVTSTTSWSNISEEWSFPSPTASLLNEGDMWFNTTASALKVYGAAAGVPAGTWASGGSINTARNGLRGGGISQDSVVVFGGTSPGVVTESYDGTTWTEVNDLSTTVTNSVGVGTQGAARAAMTTTNQGWNGTSWTEENNLNTSRQECGGLGTKASCLAMGGPSAVVEQWDGTNWTEVADLNTTTGFSTGIGTTSAGRSVGGNPTTAVNQFWNGSTWTEEADINTARYAAGGSGTSGFGLIFGGYGPSHSALTEVWNGTAWTEINDISTATSNGGPASNSPAGNALFAGGSIAPGMTAATEEWTANTTLATVTTS